MRRMIRPGVALTALGFAAALLAAAPAARAATVLVKPGRLDHFVITAPQTAVAGETFLVRIEPYDANNNLITDFRGRSGSFAVGVSGGEVSPGKLRAEDFAGGAVVKVAERRAGILELAVTEGEGVTPLASVQVRILPNRLDRFVVNTPRAVTAGEAFQARVIAQDAFGNTKTDLADIRESLRVEVTGGGAALPADKTLPPFRGGEAILSFEPRKAGTVRVAVQETRTRSAGEGPTIQVGPAQLDHFTLIGPKAAVAGEPFVVLVAAYDAFENPVTNYQESGDGVSFRPSGTGTLAPAALPAKEFRDGQARVTFTYTRAEPLRIAAREQGRDTAGQSEAILVAAADPDHFQVATPAEAVAGEGFNAQIEALDRFGNLIEDYDLRGLEVLLSTDGRGQIAPAAVSPSSFVRGKAAVSLTYNRAESFTVVAALSREALEKLVAERKRQAVPPPEPAVAPEELARQREREAAARAREEAERAREEAEKKRGREEALKARREAEKAREEAEKAAARKPEAPKAPEKAPARPAAAPGEKAAAPASPAPAKAAAPVKPAPAVVAAKAPPAPAPKAAPAPAKPSAPAAAPKKNGAAATAKTAAGRGGDPARSGVKLLEKITVEETGGQTLVRVGTSGPVSYNASTGVELGKEWIWLELFPARVDSGVAGSVPSGNGPLGQILVKQAGSDKVRVSLQVLPPGVSYVVTQQDRAVVVKIVKAP